MLTNNQLKKDGPHAPQVSLGIVLVELQDLRRHVEGGPAQGLGQPLRLQAARKAEVCNLEQRASFGGGQEEVLRLQVPLRQPEAKDLSEK
jgi:hypothetical protein